jgi:hypothetical protein
MKRVFILAIVFLTYAILVTVLLLLVSCLCTIQQSALMTPNHDEHDQPLQESDTETDINCVICLSAFSNLRKPLCLICGHTFCCLCLLQIYHENTIECPICRERTIVPMQGLAMNYILTPFIEQIRENNVSENLSREGRRLQNNIIPIQSHSSSFRNVVRSFWNHLYDHLGIFLPNL